MLLRKINSIFLALVVVLAFCQEIDGGKRKSSRPKPPRPHSYSSARNKTKSTTGGSNSSWSCPASNSSCPASFRDPPLLLISLDGFRVDYLSRHLTPTLAKLISCGVRAQHMRPVFPTTTFPNHYSIVTGLYPESHGIIDNDLYDRVLGEKLDMERNGDNPIWWKSEPLWVTAEKQQKKTATYYWLGSETTIKGVRPTYFRMYNSGASWACRIQTIVDWLDLPPESRPAFMTLYFNEPDHEGHKFGPNSARVNSTLRSLDATLSKLMNDLERKRLLNCVNIMVVSDHGMGERSCSRLVPLDRYLNLSSVYHVTGAAGRIRPRAPSNPGVIDELVTQLRCKTDKLLVAKKEELPKRFHYVDHYRIEPIILGPVPGWVVKSTTKEKNNRIICEGGTHGYDNMAVDMRALFIGFGPSFKKNVTVKPFLNIELYNLMAELIKVNPQPNNGTAGSLHHLLKTAPNVTLSRVSRQPITRVCSGSENTHYRNLAFSCNCSVANPQSSPGSVSKHLPWGSPSSSVCLLANHGYVSGYQSQLKMPGFVSYTLPKDLPTLNNPTNFTCWYVDSRVNINATNDCSLYRNHSSDIRQSSLFSSDYTNDSTAWLTTNSIPMYQGFNDVILNPFNRMLANWARRYGPINVQAGPAFDIRGNGLYPGMEHILSIQSRTSRLIIPSHFFALITRCLAPTTIPIGTCPVEKLDTMAFLLPHRQTKENCLSIPEYLRYHSAKIKDVETLTGMTFFPSLPYYDAARLATQLPEQIWH